MNTALLSLIVIPGLVQSAPAEHSVIIHIPHQTISKADFIDKYSKPLADALTTKGLGKLVVPYEKVQASSGGLWQRKPGTNYVPNYSYESDEVRLEIVLTHGEKDLSGVLDLICLSNLPDETRVSYDMKYSYLRKLRKTK